MDHTKPGNHPIHPVNPFTHNIAGFDVTVERHGLTKREMLAAMAMSGLFSPGGVWPDSKDIKEVARRAVWAADALLDELAKEQS